MSEPEQPPARQFCTCAGCGNRTDGSQHCSSCEEAGCGPEVKCGTLNPDETDGDGFGTAQLRDDETRDDTAHAARNLAQLRQAESGDPCPECEEGVLEDPKCPTCPECGYSKCYGGPADA